MDKGSRKPRVMIGFLRPPLERNSFDWAMREGFTQKPIGAPSPADFVFSGNDKATDTPKESDSK